MVIEPLGVCQTGPAGAETGFLSLWGFGNLSGQMQHMKVSDFVADFLHAQGVRHVFEVIGGMITHLLDSIHQRGQIKVVSVHHEQAAAFAADAAGRVAGVPGVAMATSGPGATNLLTGIGSCYFDSSPTVFITGQVNRSEQKGDRQVRQLGFQETDIVSMAAPITKAAWRIGNSEELQSRLSEAFVLAQSGRPGPVLLDIPMDIQREFISRDTIERVSLTPPFGIDLRAIDELLNALARSKRPLILVGGGIRSSGAVHLFRQLADRLRVPVVNSLMAVDALPASHPLRVGLIGSYGNRWANLAIGQSDFLLVLGSRLDVRQTGAMTEAFKGERMIYHVDCEVAEINNRVRGCVPIMAHLKDFCQTTIEAAALREFPERLGWLAEIGQLRRTWPDTGELKNVRGINPNQFLRDLASSSGSACAFVADVGQHQMWAAQSIEPRPTQHFLTSGGMGAMGFALPAAIGACFALGEKPVVVVAGDGGFQLNIQELQTVRRNTLPLKMVIINNRCHGMVRQFQESYFQGRYHSTYWGYSAPDFAEVARAYGIAASTISDPADVESALNAMWKEPSAPYLLQVMIDTFANAFPKIAFGHPITEMEPFVKPLEMEGT